MTLFFEEESMGKNPAQKAAQKAVEKKHEPKSAKGSKKAKGTEVEAAAEASAEPKADKKAHKHHATSEKREAKRCKVKACKREYRAKGYCRAHYKKWRHGAFGKQRYTSCSDLGCFKPAVTNRHGYCEAHFQNYYVKGMAVTKAAVPAAPAAPAKEDKAAAG